ncbi:membrane protein [Gordonia phage Pherobrine]|nr:membrane protein [Gordonia phage Pherobrine]
MPASKQTVMVLTTSAMSLVVGTLLGHIWTKKYVTDQYEGVISEEVAKAKAFYSQRNKTGEFSDPVALAESLIGSETDEFGDPVDTDSDPEDDDYIVVEGKPFREMIDPEDRVNYNALSKDYNGPAVEREQYTDKPPEHQEGESMADYERRVMEAAHERVAAVIDRVGGTDISEEVEEVVSNVFETNGVEKLAVADTSSRGSGRPYIISVSEFMDNDTEYNQNTLSYYEGDNVLTDEADQPISNVEGIVGMKNLELFGDGSGDPNIVFVRNDKMQVDFEIARSFGTYAEEVLGVAPQQRKGR